MAPLPNPLLEEVRFPPVVPPLPHATGGPDVVVRASVSPGGELRERWLAGVSARGVEVLIAISAVAPGVTRVRLAPVGVPSTQSRRGWSASASSRYWSDPLRK